MMKALQNLLLVTTWLPDLQPKSQRSVIGAAQPSKERPIDGRIESATHIAAVAPNGRCGDWAASFKSQPDTVICFKAGVGGNAAAIDGQVKQLGVLGMIGMMPNRRALQRYRVAQSIPVFNQCGLRPAIF